MFRVAVLLSGRGSNLQALIEAARDNAYPAQIVHAISNVQDAPGLQRAIDAGNVQPDGRVYVSHADIIAVGSARR